MLDKITQYSQAITFPLIKKINKPAQYKFEWVDDLEQIIEVQKFRAEQFSEQFGIQFPLGLDQDLYDFNCEHAVLRDKWTNEIVAYTRLKLLQGKDLAQSYSQHEFKIFPELNHLENVVEIGRTCVHPHYRSGKALSVLWMNLLPKILWKMRAKYLIGCVSIRLVGNEARAYFTHQYIKNLGEQQTCTIAAQKKYEPQHPKFSFVQDEKIPKLFDVYLKMNAKLSKEAFYDQDFNCLDYFVFLDVKNMAKNFILQKKVAV